MFGSGLNFRSDARTFSPLKVSNIAVWLDPNRGITLSSGKVSSWADQSGTGDGYKNMSQANSSWQPVYNASDPAYNNQPSLSFTAANLTKLVSGVYASPISAPETMFIVGNFDGAATNQYMADGGADNERVIFNNIGTSGGAMYAGTVLDSATALNSSPRVIACEFNGGTSKIYVNALTAKATGNSGSTPTRTGLVLGDFHGATASFLNGKLTEVIIYSRILTSPEFSAVMNYLGNRYAIAIGA